MSEYRTEFIVPPDRYVCLQLPPHLPEGKATITVRIGEPEPEAPPPIADAGPARETETETTETESPSDLDHQDIEWWEEFEDNGGPVEPRP